jgi:hypothetical protein
MNQKLTLYRGLTVSRNDVNPVIESIKRDGINEIHPSSQWNLKGISLKERLNELYEKKDLKYEETIPRSELVQVSKTRSTRIFYDADDLIYFGDKETALFYATHHAVSGDKNVPLIIEANIGINNIRIDGKDFLNSLFTNLDPLNPEHQNRIDALIDIYGEKIKFYIDKKINHLESDDSAVNELLKQDNEIILAHYQNTHIINGRAQTVFSQSYAVKLPIEPSSIVDVYEVDTKSGKYIYNTVGKYNLSLGIFTSRKK